MRFHISTMIPRISAVLAVVVFASVINGQNSAADNRCFLEGGGSTLSFFVKESLPVGSIIGRLNVQGQVGIDTELTLDVSQETSQFLSLDGPDLILNQDLDKEGLAGPTSFSTNVLCKRVGGSGGDVPGSNDDQPLFSIPVHIHVTDVNDNVPQWVNGAPYKLNISELTLVGTRIINNIKAVDLDQPGPFSTVEYLVSPGQKYSDYVAFENPLEGSLVLTRALDYETMKSFRVKIVARDQGVPGLRNETDVVIDVTDADDQNPAFFYDGYDALIPPGDTVGQKLMVQPQDIKAFDKDVGLGSPVFYTFNGSGDEYKYFELNRNTGQIYIMTQIPDNEFTRPVTLVVRATQYDNKDRYTVTTLTLTKGGIFDSDLQFLQRDYQVKILENAPLNTPVTTLLTNKPLDRRVHFVVDKDSLPSEEFSVSQKGEVMLRKTLDYEKTDAYSFVVYVTDGKRNDSARVNVSVLNINDWDPRFKYPQYEFHVRGGDVGGNDVSVGQLVGRLDVYDGDKGDKTMLEVRGPYARVFSIDQQGGLRIADMRHMNGTVAHIVVVAKDSGIPARQTSVPVIVHFPRGSSPPQPRSLEANVFMVTLVLGLISGLLLLVICGMMVYICKGKKRRLPTPGEVRATPHKKTYSTYGGGEAYNTRSEIMYAPATHFHEEGSNLQRHHSQSALNPLNPHHRKGFIFELKINP